MQKQKVLAQMKQQYKIPEKETKWSRDRQHSRKIIQNNNSEDDPGSLENNGEDVIQKHKPKENWNDYINSRQNKLYNEDYLSGRKKGIFYKDKGVNSTKKHNMKCVYGK